MKQPGTGFWQRTRLALWLGLGALIIGILDIWILLIIGLEFELSGRDGTLFMGAFLAVSFGLFGWFLGLAIAARKQEQAAARERNAALYRLAEAQGRVAHMEKMAALGQVAASIAHEVRNPLAIIRSHVQNLSEEDSQSLQDRTEDYDILLEEIDRLARVIEGVGQFAHPTRPRLAEISPDLIVDRLRFMTRVLYKDLGYEAVRILRSKSDTTFTSDADLICQVLMTLVINAMEANPTGETVTLAIEPSTEHIRFSVSDHGPGVPAHLGERIFEPFITTKPQGNGLGLAIARHIAEALGGRLNLAGVDPGGSRFSLEIPRSPMANLAA